MASELVVAVALGLVVANAVDLPDAVAPGLATHGAWLAAGIVLMGSRVSLSTLLSTGPTLAVLVVGVVALTLALVEGLATVAFDVRGKLGSLLAAGASVCGVSAAVGVAGSIDADEDDLAYAAGTILLFDVCTLFAYPVLAGALGLPERVFGVWAGLTMFSTGPVTAAGFAVGDVAGRWATVTKLTRNLLLGVLVVGYSLWYARVEADVERDAPRVEERGVADAARALWASFPTFVLGFFAVVVVTSSGFVPEAATAGLERAYRALFLVAFAGLGLAVDVDDLRSTGVAPIAVVFATLVVTSSLALVATRTLLGG